MTTHPRERKYLREKAESLGVIFEHRESVIMFLCGACMPVKREKRSNQPMTIEKIKTMTGVWADISDTEKCDLLSIPLDTPLCIASYTPLSEVAELLAKHRIKTV